MVSIHFPLSITSHSKRALLTGFAKQVRVILLQKGEDDAAALGAASFTNLSLADGIDGS
jgi:hypothetical protein